MRSLDTKALALLKAAMKYVGSYYVPTAQTSVLEQKAKNLLAWPGFPQDGIMVQGLLLMVIGLNSINHRSTVLVFLPTPPR